MFVLNPGGGGANDGESSQTRLNLRFFGQLGLYFAVIRGAYVFFASRENKALKD
jgi:hypothetical protein